MRDSTFSRFDTVPACDRQTVERTNRRTHDDSIYSASIATRSKKIRTNKCN